MGTKTCHKACSLGTLPAATPCGKSPKPSCSCNAPQQRGQGSGTARHIVPVAVTLWQLCAALQGPSVLCPLLAARVGQRIRGLFITSPSLQKLPWPRVHGTAGSHPSQFSIFPANPSNRLVHLIGGLLLV